MIKPPGENKRTRGDHGITMQKNSQSIALLRKAKQFVNHNTLLNMFNAFVLPHFTYCSNIWNDGSSSYEIRSTEIFEKLGWVRIEIILKKRELYPGIGAEIVDVYDQF